MNRRTFVLRSSIAALIAACGQRTVASDATRKETVIIVGAGMAGLAAARTLHNLGYAVTLLEGRDRTGGRVWTSHLWPEIPVDLGASWIHGENNNPLTKLANTVGSKRLVTDYENSMLYETEGHAVSDKAERDTHRIFDKLVRLAFSNAADCETILEAIEGTALWKGMSKQQRQSVMHLMNTTIEHELAGSLNEISIASPDDAEELSGKDVIFPDGYSSLTDYLANGLDIKLEQIVEKIDYQNKKITVKTSKGQFLADRVIVTLPVGVLKNDTVKFEPALPADKQQAISATGSGLLDKLFLKFPYTFWDRDREILNWISDEHGRWNEWLNIAAYTNKPVLLGFNAADYAQKIEAWSDRDIVTDAMSVLRTIYGNEIPEPESWQVTRWGEDPFARGSYSFNAVGADHNSRTTLAEAIDSRLFFAGEATSVDYPATVHGAYFSGIDAAKAIINLHPLS